MSNASVIVGTPYTRITDLSGTHRLAVDARISTVSAIGDVTAAADPFGRLRVSAPASIFDSKQVYDDQPLLFTTHTEGSGSTLYVQSKAATTLTGGAGAGRALRQTKRYFNYQPGKGQLIFTTFNFNGSCANVTKSAGYYDDNNGIFFKVDSTGPSVVRRSNVSGSVDDLVKSRSEWNIDPLDGTGPSGIDIDLNTVQILVIDFQWLGVGAVKVGFCFGQSIVYVHQFEQANVGTVVYAQTPNLPVRWEVVNSAAPGAGTPSIDAICCSVQSEGGVSPLSVQRTGSRGVIGASADTTLRSMLSLRLKSAYNRATVFPLNGSVVTTDTGVDYYGQLVLNPTFGAPLSFTGVTNSPVELSDTVTTVTGGTVIGEFYGISGAPGKSGSASITTTADLNSVLALASNYAGTQDVVTVAVRTFSGTSTSSMFALFDWLELL